MSIFSNLLEVGKSLVVGLIDAPLDGRTRVDTLDDIPDIPNPFVGMKIYCRADKKTYTVHSLKAKTIGSVTIENRQIDEYKTDAYTAGENITISEDGVISAKDTKYSAGNGIEISAEGVISCTVSGGEYTAGNGLTLTGTSFAVDTDIIASREYVDGKIGNINSILDAINGEEI